MALPISQQAKYWGIAAFIFLLLMWLMGDVLVPFLVGGAIAYFLDPVADRLQRLGLNRATATALIMVLMALVMVLLVLAVIPTLIQQTVALVNAAPDIARDLQTFLTDRFPDLTDETSIMRTTLADIGAFIQSKGADLAQGVVSSAMTILSAVIFIVVVPVVAFYLLLDWDRMVARIDAMIPRDHLATVRHLAREIDTVLAGFVRGQLTVCLIVGAYYSVTLMLAGLQFGLLVGAIAGAVSFIPYVGAIIGGVLAIGLALFQFWGDWFAIGIVVAIFAVGQFIEGNILTPKLVGSSVGLHPVWLLLALSVFGALLGFAGMLIAVPVAAALGVLARFAIGQYQGSVLYRGIDAAAPVPVPKARNEEGR